MRPNYLQTKGTAKPSAAFQLIQDMNAKYEGKAELLAEEKFSRDVLTVAYGGKPFHVSRESFD